MKLSLTGANLYLILFLTTAWFAPAFATDNKSTPASPSVDNPYADTASVSAEYPVFRLCACKITVLKSYLWRDWMPIVAKPGSDKGSPLHSKIELYLDNSAGSSTKLSYQGVVVSSKGQSYPATFAVLPNYRLIPESIDNPTSWQAMDETARNAVLEKYRVLWNGELKPGETRKIELLSADGPYLPDGDTASVKITLTDQKGRSAVVESPLTLIHKTY
jgi:hypothetical protein